MATTLAPDDQVGRELPRFAVEQRQLGSGLRVGVESVGGGAVAAVLVVGSGAGADPRGQEGLAHLVEHLVFRAHGPGEPALADRLARLGATYNAETELETTRFHELAPAQTMPALLVIAGERLLRPLEGVDQQDFERERAIVENELTERNEVGVYGQVMGWIQRDVFPAGHRHARPVGGSADTLRRLTLAQARSFAATHYRPQNATLLVAGALEARRPLSALVAQLPEGLRRRADGPAPANRAPLEAQPLSSPPDRAPAELRAAVVRPEIWLAYDLGNAGTRATVSRILTAPAAEAIVRQRLMREPEVLTAGFHPLELGGHAVLACQIVLEHGRRRQELARRAQNLVWSLWSDRGPPAAIETTDWQEGTPRDLRQAAVASALFGAEPLLDRALERASLFHATGAADAYDRLLGAVAVVPPDQLSDQAFTLLAPERARTLFIEPLADGPRPGPVPLAGDERLIMAGGPLRAATVGPLPRFDPPPELRAVETRTQANGLTVILVPRPQFPSVTALLGFHGGGAALPAGLLGLVRAVSPRGQNRRLASPLEVESLDGPGFTADLVRADRAHLSNALYLLASRLEAVATTDFGGLLRREQARAPAAPPPVEPRQRAAARLRTALYGEHPYAGVEDPNVMRRLNPTLPSVWLPRLYNPRNAVLVIAGDIDPARAAHLADGWFADWTAGPGCDRLSPPPVPPPARQRSRETVLITDRPITTQVEMTFACRLAAPITLRDEVAQRALAALLGGSLMTQVREEAGAAYSVDARVESLPAGGAHLALELVVDSRRLRDALRVLRADLATLAAGQIDPNALGQVRWSLERQQLLRDQTGAQLAERLFRASTLGRRPDTLTAEGEESRQLTREDLLRAFAPCLAAPVLSFVGDEATIRGAL
jgi:zinc protease